jgi:hypothetical protein
MKNAPKHVCAKTAFVGWPSIESRRISSSRNFLSYNHEFRKRFKLVYRKKCGYGNFDHRYNVSPVHLYALFGAGNFTKVVRACMERTSDDTSTNKLYGNKPEDLRLVWRPRKRWLDEVEQDLKQMGVRGWRRRAQNRDEWRSILKKAKVV